MVHLLNGIQMQRVLHQHEQRLLVDVLQQQDKL